ncbi:DivIVA domain-containing protein [Actinoplanes sp. DH11]|uniref:DivIVA domain-containing protein n=1 Tax=Actinoplanes sp. DH11 TaxID=2857011 RepID=UPI001E4A1F1E|nr:DivIVA domain-containing protein [Actinoplanes sp. DH11]
MTSQGQRFRRRALRRGYKVDEVDAFLDRVEATLAGEQVGPPVGAQEVHDVVFRVRFGGYDEWQVDLHLDRVERQLAEFEERGGRPAPDPLRDSMRGGLSAVPQAPQGPPPGMMGAPQGMGGPQGMGAPQGMGGPQGMAQLPPGGGMPDRGMPGQGMPDRGMPDRGMPDRGMPDRGMPDRGMPGQGMPGQGMPDRGMPGQGMPDRGMPPGQGMPGGGPGMNPAAARMAPPTERLPAPVRDDRMMPPQMPPQMPQRQQQMPQPDPYGRYDEPGYGQQQPPQRPGPPPGYDQGGYDQPRYDQGGGYDQGGYDQAGGYDGFEPGRHGKADMTAEIRMPDRDPRGGYGGQGMPGQGMPSAMPGSPMPGAPMSGAPGGYGPPPQQFGPPMGEPGGELHRVDQLRRTFQPRRFGSGYDPMQVDRLFEGILQAMTGRGPMPVNENDLDMLQFGLVPNGYFEAEVDAALREVKDILLRRR